MTFLEILTGQFLENERTVRRLPLLLAVFIIIILYIGIGYKMQSLELRERDLRDKYQELHGTSVVLHERMIQETAPENLEFLISKYKLNIETKPVSPFVIEK